MSKSFFVVFLVFAVFVGCNSADKEKATKPSDQSTESKPEEGHHQYRAVCIEKEEHGGNEYVLSKWFDSKDKANELAQYHGDFKYKGHRWRIDERVRPERVKP